MVLEKKIIHSIIIFEEKAMILQTPKTQILLGTNVFGFSQKIILSSLGASVLYLPPIEGLKIVGIFKAPIFRCYPETMTEILKGLILIVGKVYPVIPVGRLKFRVIEEKEQRSTVTLYFSSREKERAPFTMSFNCNAHEAAWTFLQIMNSPQPVT